MTGSGRRKAPRGLDVEIIVESPLWREQERAEQCVRGALAAVAAKLPTALGDVAIVLTDDAAVRALNRKWRRIDEPTNVLSFPAKPAGTTRMGSVLGDIVI